MAFPLEQDHRARGRPEVLETTLPKSRLALDVDVESHDLAHYDHLLDEGDDDDQPS